MPTFEDPVADGAEVRGHFGALAHATLSFASPARPYEVVGELLRGLCSLHHVLG